MGEENVAGKEDLIPEYFLSSTRRCIHWQVRRGCRGIDTIDIPITEFPATSFSKTVPLGSVASQPDEKSFKSILSHHPRYHDVQKQEVNSLNSVCFQIDYPLEEV